MSVNVPILCFNDVYRVSQKYVPQPGAPRRPGHSETVKKGEGKEGRAQEEKIGVSQFGCLLHSERAKWADRAMQPQSSSSQSGKSEDKKSDQDEQVIQESDKDGLVLFAGDVFNPSVESSVTRGSHMVPVMNALKVDCACVGNHDFDFGFPHLTKLIQSTNFPWLLSNIIDKNTGKVPHPLRRFWVTERCGVKIGVVGLVEKDWIATIPSWPETFEYQPMKETALQLSKELRDPNGPHGVDIVIALTHCRVPNDIALANELGAVNPAKADRDIAAEHGVDLLIGGHDHIYYIGSGASEWDGFSGDRSKPGAENDKGVHLIKSGTDFRDLSSAVLGLSQPSKSIRKRTIQQLTGKHHYVLPSSPSSPEMDELLKSLLSSVSSTLSKPVCFSLTPFDARSELVRTQEVGLGNWVADVLMHAYAESLIAAREDREVRSEKSERTGEQRKVLHPKNVRGEADAVIICGGTLRGDSQYGPGQITLGDILEILPFEDPAVCIEIDGKGIWDTLESALSKWPAQEGRFPIIAGMQVIWDHRLPSGKRVKSIHLLEPPKDEEDGIESPDDMVDFVEQEDGTRVEVKQRKSKIGEEVKNDSSKTYRVITRDYMAQGYDGFTALKNRKFIVDDENGLIMSSIIRSFLLGSSFIFRHKQLADAHKEHLSTLTAKLLDKARAEHQSSPSVSPRTSPKSSKLGLRLPTSPLSPTQEKKDFFASPVDGANTAAHDGSPSHPARRHVVNHNWANIRAAMRIAKTEHMSEVDELRGDDMRRQHTSIKPADADPTPTIKTLPVPDAPEHTTAAAFFVDEASKEELKTLSEDLAIVCPLIDGRLKDLGAEE